MDDRRFEAFSQANAAWAQRRALLQGTLAALVAGLAGSAVVVSSEARKRRKKRKKNKVRFNDFGCVSVGGFCKKDGQCCSGMCQGKKDRKTCQEHDASTCQAGELPAVCGGRSEFCISSDGFEGACATTTGSGGYCFASGDCFACTNDVDCEAACGPGAACIPCAETCGPARGGTFCAGLAADSCNFDA